MDHPQHVVHLEHDGKVLLVDDSGEGPHEAVKGRVIESPILRFPTPVELSAMGIEWTSKRTVSLTDVHPDVRVDFGYPAIAWPSHWPWKDDLISDNAVHPVARESVYRTIHRVVSKVIVTDADGMVLMVALLGVTLWACGRCPEATSTTTNIPQRDAYVRRWRNLASPST